MNHLSSLSLVMSSLAEVIPPVVSTAPRTYPFVGQKAVKTALITNGFVQLTVLAMLFHLQTELEQATRDTKVKNRQGFMSSDAWTGTRLAEKIIAGETLNDEETARASQIACKYSRQLTVALRDHAMRQDETLAATAAMFSVV